MADWKLYTPEGTQDVLPKQCAYKAELEATIASVFERFGYHVAETPILQFYDAFDTQDGKIPQEMMYKFFDAQGRILVLRPDITTCFAWMMASKMDDGIYPKRLHYCGKVFRYIDEFASGQREFCQAGIELYGADGDVADAEVIACAIEALLAAGLEKFQIEIGQVEFYKGIIAQTGLTNEESEILCGFIDKKDALAISEFLKGKKVDEKLAAFLEELPTLFGSADILSGMDAALLGSRAMAALNNLKNVYDLLCAYGYEEYVSIDLSLVQGINRYTGIIFKGITHGIGFSVCSGGRYNGLTGEFGNSLSAVGMAIGTDRLLTVLTRQQNGSDTLGADFLVSATNPATAYQVVTALRDSGYCAEQALSDETGDALLRYAEANNIQGIITVASDGKIKIYNISLDETHETDLETFLIHDEGCNCDACHGKD